MTDESPVRSYVHGYSAATDTMAVRTLESFAGFLGPCLKSGMKVLDAGCGPGTISVGIATVVSPGALSGVDIEQSQVALATELASAEGLTNTNFEVAVISDLRYESNSFDLAFSCGVLEHIPSVDDALAELTRVLRPGGLIALKSGTPSNIVAIPPADCIDRFFDIYLPVWERLGGHPDYGTEQVGRLQELGFDVLTVNGTFDSETPRLLNMPDRLRASGVKQIAEEHGISNKEELDRLADEVEVWWSRPNATILAPWVEVVARKPS